MISEATRDMVTETSRGRFTFASAACAEVLGHRPEDLVGSDPRDLHHPDDVEAFLAVVRQRHEPGVPFHVPPHRLRRSDGSWVWVEATGVWDLREDGERRLIGVARDITARLEAAGARAELEDQVRRAQKLESLGALTGGIAHDFNNLLTPILGAAGLMLLELPDDSPLRKRVATIQQAAKRAADLTGQMLAYAGGTDLELRPVDVTRQLQDTMLLLESSVGREATLRVELADALPPVMADPGQLSQVLVNLVVNASEATREGPGAITVRTSSEDLDRAQLDACVLGERRAPGRYVAIDVRDQGRGIDPETLERIFDPFFSTKFTGRGLVL
jgi:PAS domain S-box-containing protein